MKDCPRPFQLIKALLMSAILMLCFSPNAEAQFHVNKEWKSSPGNPVGLQWTNSIFDANEQLVSVGNTYVAGQGANILTTKYDDEGSKAFAKANELIVRFQASALNIAAIDNNIGTAEIDFAGIDYFLTDSALLDFNNATSGLCSSISSGDNPCGIEAIKVFKQLKTTHTTTKSRLGETIKIPGFWTTLLLVFPAGMDIELVYNALKAIPEVVVYSDLNYIAELTAGANDSLYQ